MVWFKKGEKESNNGEVVVIKSDNIHQESKHDIVSHRLAEEVTASGLHGVSGVKIPFEDIDSVYNGVGLENYHHTVENISQK